MAEAKILDLLVTSITTGLGNTILLTGILGYQVYIHEFRNKGAKK